MNRRSFLASTAGAVITPHLRLPTPKSGPWAEAVRDAGGLPLFSTMRNECGPPLSVESLREALRLFEKMADERSEPYILHGPLYLHMGPIA